MLFKKIGFLTKPVSYYLDRAEVLLEEGRLEPAYKTLRRAYERHPNNQVLAIRFAKLAERQGQMKKALELYTQAITAKGEDARGWWFVRRAQVALTQGDLAGALADYKEAVKRNPEQAGWQAAYEDLKRRYEMGGDGAEALSSYYDSLYVDSKEYKQSAHESVYFPMWQRISEVLREYDIQDVLDVGCGPGQFAEFLLERGHLQYSGFDFSQMAVEIAKARCADVQFYHADALKTDLFERLKPQAIICTEVLEHIDADLALMERFPPGSLAVCSVPSFHAFGHVRVFADEQTVIERYGRFFNDVRVEAFMLSGHQFLYLFYGYIK